MKKAAISKQTAMKQLKYKEKNPYIKEYSFIMFALMASLFEFSSMNEGQTAFEQYRIMAHFQAQHL